MLFVSDYGYIWIKYNFKKNVHYVWNRNIIFVGIPNSVYDPFENAARIFPAVLEEIQQIDK